MTKASAAEKSKGGKSGELLSPLSGVRSRLLMGPRHKEVTMDADWFAGPLAPEYSKTQKCLPVLHSGMPRPQANASQRKELVSAAFRLSEALGSLGSDKLMKSRHR